MESWARKWCATSILLGVTFAILKDINTIISPWRIRQCASLALILVLKIKKVFSWGSWYYYMGVIPYRDK